MKKHDEGYVLAYVTVVLLIFCLVATVILTGALRNLQTQQDANERMKHQYIAAGEIEKVLAQWKPDFWDKFDPAPQKGIPLDGANVKYLGRSDTEVTLYAESGTVCITCKISIAGDRFTYYKVGTVAPPENGGDGS